MSLESLLTQTVTLIYRSSATWATDEEGISTAEPDEVDAKGLIQQQTSIEDNESRPNTITSDHLLFLLPTTAVTGLEQVRESGRLFEVVGEPDIVRTPRGPHHIEVPLRLIRT